MKQKLNDNNLIISGSLTFKCLPIMSCKQKVRD